MGSHVAAELISGGNEVVILDDLSGGFKENVPQRSTLVAGSVADHELADKIVREEKIEYIFHLAAYASEASKPFHKKIH